MLVLLARFFLYASLPILPLRNVLQEVARVFIRARARAQPHPREQGISCLFYMPCILIVYHTIHVQVYMHTYTEHCGTMLLYHA